jgi:methyltransferase family protein
MQMNSLSLPNFIPRRYRHANCGSWSGHLAFANDLIAAIQPRIIVELGTHWGESYFGFCQSVAEQKLSCLCYAVDHWQGDEHAGLYGEEVYQDVHKYNDTHYNSFSYLLRTDFDQALSYFDDCSIDLLHIDGFHTYEAGSHDFRSWLPKIRPRGIVLLHDIVVRERNFGVWRLWDEIKVEFPETFEFHHSFGLGVVRKPGEDQQPALLKALFDSPASIQDHVRRLYVVYASHVDHMLASANKKPSGGVEGDELRRELQRSEEACSRAMEELASLRASLELEQRMRWGMEHSRSWRITKPLRSFMLALRGKPRTVGPK